MIRRVGPEEWSELQRRHLADKSGRKLAGGRKVEIVRIEKMEGETRDFWRILGAGIVFLAAMLAYDFSREERSAIRKVLKEIAEEDLGKIRFRSLQRVERLSQTSEGLPTGSRRVSVSRPGPSD